MSTRSHYDILGVAETATAEEIRKAFDLRSSVLRPDRFDRQTQAEEWTLASDMQQQVNVAYSVLKDPAARADYDRSAASVPRTAGFAGRNATSANAKPRALFPAKPRTLGPGRHHTFSSLSKEQQQRLLARQADRVTPQLRIQLVSGGRHYLWLLIWTVMLLAASMFHRIPLQWFVLRPTIGRPWWDWKANLALFYWGVLTIATAGVFVNFARIIRLRKGPLRTNFFVTPRYLIKTAGEDVWLWPLAQLRRIRLEPKVRGLVSFGLLTLVFSDAEIAIGLVPLRSYPELEAFIRSAKADDTAASSNEP